MVVVKNEDFPPTTSDGAEDLYNSGLASCIVDVRGVYGATTFKCCVAGPMVIAVKVLIGVTEYALAACAMNSYCITEEPKECGARTHVIDTLG